MLPSLLLFSKLKLPVLEMENITFQELDQDNFGDLDARYQRPVDKEYYKTGENTYGLSGQARTESEFFLCSVNLDGSVIFENNYAFGAGLASANGGAGGALFVSFCSLTINGKENNQNNNDHFTGNKAAVGGAIAALYSNVLLNGVKFVSNEAYKFAGALYLQGFEPKTGENAGKRAVLYWQLRDGAYTGNKAQDVGGAIVATAGLDLYIEGTELKENKAGISGGALYIINTPTKLYNSKLILNEAGVEEIYNKGIKKQAQVPITINLAGRGGGAIYFMSDNHFKTAGDVLSKEYRILYTQECCFSKNKATNGHNFAEENASPGHIIMFNGACQWHSQDDAVKIDELSIGHVKSQFGAELIRANYNTQTEGAVMENACGSGDANKPAYETGNAKEFTFDPYDGGEQKVGVLTDAPTEFEYEATPLTELPYATTSSWINYGPTVEFVKIDNTKTIKRTLINTPQESKMPTFADTPFPTLFDTPINTPEETPEKTGLTPAKTRYIATPARTAKIEVSVIDLQTEYSIRVKSKTVSGNTEIEIYIWSKTYGYTVVETGVEVSMDDGEAQNDGENGQKDNNLVVIIAVVISGIILIIIIALLVWFFVGYSKSSSSSDSVVEMDEETVLHVPDSTSAPITNDNPLWTTSVMGDTDDPFRNDFEEVAAEGFFNERAETVDSDP